MKKIKLTTFDHIPSIKKDFPKYTPNLSGKWEDFEFFLNEKLDQCDYWIVSECLPQKESTICSKKNTIFIAGEASSIKRYNKKFLNQFSHIITCQRRIKHHHVHYTAPGLSWFSKKNYDELISSNKMKKDKLISIVVSNKSWTPEHKKRLEFCLKLKEYFGDKIDLFGRGLNGFDDKWDVLAPYKYSIAIENSVETDWMTEKIGDCFTSLTFPFYYGCTNINDYYSPNSYELIDLDSFDKSCKIIENIINNDEHYEQHLDYLIESKNRYLNQYCLIPLIVNFIKKEYKENKNYSAETITLKPEKSFENNYTKYFYKIFDRIRRMLK